MSGDLSPVAAAALAVFRKLQRRESFRSFGAVDDLTRFERLALEECATDPAAMREVLDALPEGS